MRNFRIYLTSYLTNKMPECIDYITQVSFFEPAAEDVNQLRVQRAKQGPRAIRLSCPFIVWRWTLSRKGGIIANLSLSVQIQNDGIKYENLKKVYFQEDRLPLIKKLSLKSISTIVHRKNMVQCERKCRGRWKKCVAAQSTGSCLEKENRSIE